MTDSAACVLAHIALHKQLHPNLTDAIPAVVAALCKEIDTEEQLCDGDVTCEYVCQPAVEFLAHMASQSANLIDIGLANGIEALARAVAVEPGKQRVTERAILALNLIASGGPSFSNAVARWRNVTNFRNQIGMASVLRCTLNLSAFERIWTVGESVVVHEQLSSSRATQHLDGKDGFQGMDAGVL